MYNQDNKKDTTMSTILTLTITLVVSLTLSFPIMEIIKHAPGVNFKTEMEYFATQMLVSSLFFIAIVACIRVIKYFINGRKASSDKNAKIALERKKKGFKRLGKTAITIVTVALMGFLIMLIAMAVIFAGTARH